MRHRYVAVLVCILAAFTPAAKADESPLRSLQPFQESLKGPFSIRVIPVQDRPPFTIIIAGEIPVDAGERLRDYVAAYHVPPHGADVVLNSPGGSLLGGLRLGRTIRELRFDTDLQTIYDTATCYSACAYAFLGGINRAIGPGSIGFHQFSLHPTLGGPSDTGTAIQAAQGLMVMIDAYLADMGVSHELLGIAALEKPDDLYVVHPSEAERLRINFNENRFQRPWQLVATPTGIASTTQTDDGERSAAFECGREGRIKLVLMWNRRKGEQIPNKTKLTAYSPKFTIEGFDIKNVELDDVGQALNITFTAPALFMKGMVMHQSIGRSSLNSFYAGIYASLGSHELDNLMMDLPDSNLAATFDAVARNCR